MAQGNFLSLCFSLRGPKRPDIVQGIFWKRMGESVDKRYGWLFSQLLMLFIDFAINASSPLLYQHYTLQLVFYVFQDTMTVMAVILMFVSFSATYVCNAGLLPELVYKFQATVYSSTLYLVFSIIYHFWSLKLRSPWERTDDYIWTLPLLIAYVTQRTCKVGLFENYPEWSRVNGAVFYYYFYKRTALMLGDPRFHQDSPWLREKVSKKS